MQVFRYSSFAKERIKIRGRDGLLLLGLAGCLWLGAWLYLPWRYYLMCAGVPFFLGALKFFFRAANAWFGDRGENSLENVLQGLDDRYVLVRNWVPVEDKPTGDIDFVLLGPFGALVIEVKTYSVPTKCEGDKWWIQRSNGSWRPIKSPSRQLARNVAIVSRKLKTKASGVLVFNDRADLKLLSPSATVLRRKQLLAHIDQLSDVGTDAAKLWSRISQFDGDATGREPRYDTSRLGARPVGTDSR